MTNALIISCCCLPHTFNPLSFYEAYLLYSTLPHEAHLPHSLLLYLMLFISYCTYPESDPLCSSDCLPPSLFLGCLSPTHISLSTECCRSPTIIFSLSQILPPRHSTPPPPHSHPKLGLWLVCLKATVTKFFRAASQHKNTPQIQVRSNGEVQ
jgi:hypothetical protein